MWVEPSAPPTRRQVVRPLECPAARRPARRLRGGRAGTTAGRRRARAFRCRSSLYDCGSRDRIGHAVAVVPDVAPVTYQIRAAHVDAAGDEQLVGGEASDDVAAGS